jgi:prepilin-type N-terminal cleavage/methylation domain-containing protein
MKKRNGFTLVELLSVTAIIVALVSIFLPSVQNIKQQTNSTCCQYNPWNDIILSPVELVLVSPDGISGGPTIVGTFLVWGQLSENPDPYDSYDLNFWICDNRCVSTKCRCRHCWTSHTCIDQSEDNAKGIVSGSLVNKTEQKQSAR